MILFKEIIEDDIRAQKHNVKLAGQLFMSSLATPKKQRPVTPNGSHASVTRRASSIQSPLSSPSKHSSVPVTNVNNIILLSRKRRRLEFEDGDGEENDGSAWDGPEKDRDSQV